LHIQCVLSLGSSSKTRLRIPLNVTKFQFGKCVGSTWTKPSTKVMDLTPERHVMQRYDQAFTFIVVCCNERAIWLRPISRSAEWLCFRTQRLEMAATTGAIPIPAVAPQVPAPAPTTTTPGILSSFHSSSLLQQRFVVFAILLLITAACFFVLFQYYNRLMKEVAEAKEANEEISHQLKEARQLLSLVGGSNFEMEEYDDMEEEEEPPYTPALTPKKQHPKKKQQEISPLFFMMQTQDPTAGKATIEEIKEDDEEDKEIPAAVSAVPPALASATETLQEILSEEAPAKKKSKKKQPQQAV
jgi:hypothetical protein